YTQNRALKTFHSVVETLDVVVVLRLLSPVAHHPHGLGILIVVGNDGAALSICAQILAGIETETSQVAEQTAAATFVFGTMRLRRILDDHEIVLAGDLQNRTHVCWLPMQMDRKNHLGSWRDGAFDLRGVHRGCLGVHIHQYGTCVGVVDSGNGCYKGERHGNDFIPWADTSRQQSQMQGTGSRIHAHTMLCPATVRSERLLETCNFAPQHELRGVEHTLDGCVDLWLDAEILCLQI